MSPSAAALEYLTVQDILWANLRLTGKTNPFRFAKLEEATFCQYGYGQSQDVLAQAAKLLTGFMKLAPFGGEGDDATAFVACHAFLAMNGHHLAVPPNEAKTWVERIKAGQVDAANAIAQLVKESDFHEVGPEPALQAAIEAYGSAF